MNVLMKLTLHSNTSVFLLP